MPKRLFIALELPADCREALAAVATPIPGVRWLAADQLHLTLAFLGNVDAETELQLRDRLAELRVPAFILRLSGVRMFQARRSAVIWAGAEDADDGLMSLHGEVLRALAAANIEMKPASFRPHITLARLKDFPACKLRSFLEANKSREFGTVAIEGCALFSSVLGPDGAVHSVEERYPLVAR
jgi:2'-5' RNA ligase